jgi:hypothetical protein
MAKKFINGIEVDGIISKTGGTANQLLNADGGVTEKTTSVLREVAYAVSVTDAYNEQQPNFFIDLTGNITLAVSGITSGGGIVNLNRSTGTEVITLTGITSGNHNYLTGVSDTIRLTYSFEQGAVVWGCENPLEAGGNVDSVNSQTGVVVLDADDIDDTVTTNKFTTVSDISKLAGIEANATADQTGAEIESLIDAQLGSTSWKTPNLSNINAFDKENFTATASQTVFTLTDSPNKVNVSVNGALQTEVTDYTYDVGVVTFGAGLTVSDNVDIDKYYFNSDAISKTELYSLIETPLIEGEGVVDGFWGTGGTLGVNTGFSAFSVPILASAGDKILVQGMVTSVLPTGQNYGRQIDASGTVIGSSLASTDYSAALGGWVLTVPSTVGIAGVLLNVVDSALSGVAGDITVYRGDEIVYSNELVVKSDKLDRNDKVSVVTDVSFNYNTQWFDEYYYNGSGLPQYNAAYSALRDDIPVINGESILFSGITFAGTTNYFRFYDAYGAFLSSKSSDDLQDVAFGKKLIVDIATVAYMKLWLNTANFDETSEIYVKDSFLNVNQIKDKNLYNNQALALAGSTYFQRGKDGEPASATTVCIEIIGQSQFDGRIPIADYPAWYTGAGNTLAGAKVCDDGTGVFADYSDAQQKTISASQRFGVDLFLYKKIYDDILADAYYIKTTLGGTSLYTTGEGAGRWTPDFDIMEDINAGWTKLTLEQRNTYIAASTGANSAQTTNVSAIIWMQGESDRIAPEFYYETMLKKIMYDRGVKNNPYIPYILCGVSPDSVQYSFDVELAKQQLANNFHNVYYVAAPTGLGNLQGDELHFNATGGEIFAESIYQQLITIGVI